MSEPINDGGPAFPAPLTGKLNSAGKWLPDATDGMSLRDWFAGQALAGRLANSALLEHMEESETPSEDAPAICAHWSYLLADAMLTEREKRKT